MAWRVIASFATGPGATTLPIGHLFRGPPGRVKPEINAICTIVIAIVAIGLLAASLLVKFHDIAGERGGKLEARV